MVPTLNSKLAGSHTAMHFLFTHRCGHLIQTHKRLKSCGQMSGKSILVNKTTSETQSFIVYYRVVINCRSQLANREIEGEKRFPTES